MRSIVYDVAVSTDGFIAGPGSTPAETIQHFLGEGQHVTDYLARLEQYDTALMGRHTYEFGYGFGLEPGRAAYAHMSNVVFSRTMPEPKEHDDNFRLLRHNPAGVLDEVHALRSQEGGTIYLCGGGDLAGSLLAAGLIDRLLLKLNPIALGQGVRLFGERAVNGCSMELVDTTVYDSGVVLLDYQLSYV